MHHPFTRYHIILSHMLLIYHNPKSSTDTQPHPLISELALTNINWIISVQTTNLRFFILSFYILIQIFLYLITDDFIG